MEARVGVLALLVAHIVTLWCDGPDLPRHWPTEQRKRRMRQGKIRRNWLISGLARFWDPRVRRCRFVNGITLANRELAIHGRFRFIGFALMSGSATIRVIDRKAAGGVRAGKGVKNSGANGFRNSRVAGCVVYHGV